MISLRPNLGGRMSDAGIERVQPKARNSVRLTMTRSSRVNASR
jgi:hypothetical protein